jgi:hypothetical protein
MRWEIRVFMVTPHPPGKLSAVENINYGNCDVIRIKEEVPGSVIGPRIP